MPEDASFESRWLPVWKTLAAVPGYKYDVLAVLNGAVGDQLESTASPMALPMTLLSGSTPLDFDTPLADQIPEATGRISVFVHGLMSSERIWTSAPEGDGVAVRLAEELSITPIYVRFNSGRHISINGQQLAEMLEALVERWPVKIEELNLLGHSMGGLVSRSASHYGQQGNMTWIRHLKRMFLMAVPLRGSPLEQLAQMATVTLNTIPNPVTWIIGWVFKQRSAGIKDLRHGYIVDEEWTSRSPDDLSFGRRFPVPLIDSVDHYVIAGNLASDEHHPISKIVGDALVTPFSAKDEGFDGTPTERAAKGAEVFPGRNHINIVNDEAVYQQICKWWRAEA